ncbi:putative alpha/beta hydrolase [Prochlorococcus sp. SS52]|nr:putative alpha/beta hydrolase [Prochlorococcus marinus str. LG]KGG21092.1 putative alpha/beta hydrolase [Prochlorococcus marinus str. SS2]KGG23918.1 putative alpha/beta hydrolase [Prochlorococcus marinus str. SS35]KGG31823.1 putative alpha/beta hydrolase [Prochlorococcus marinus str. SS51]KGG36012.1 putative alpha/beta hydrolase [Prochlorococcus sp. SS52]
MEVAWKKEGTENNEPFSILLIHGFGANKEHWRKNQTILGTIAPCYSIDLIGFGESSQPPSKLLGEKKTNNNFCYNFDNWGEQIADFSRSIIKKPVLLIGNSIGGVIALRAAQILGNHCKGVILINCAQRLMDDKQLLNKPVWERSIRPILKLITRQRWLSRNLFKNAARQSFIKKVLQIAYPSGKNIDEELINMLYRPTKRAGASEAFHGFINIFNDYLAPELMEQLSLPVYLIWGKDDPWEPIAEAENWYSSIKCIQSITIIKECGHCPHDENPEEVNPVLIKIIQQAT